MLDGAEQGLCPHHEVKLTFMKLTKVTGWLSVCRYGFTRQCCSVLLPLQTWCVLFSLPAREGWNAWKRHYCALTWPTVNGWVKVPFEMYVISKGKEKKKKRAQQNLVHVSRCTPLGYGQHSHKRMILPHHLLVVNLQFKLSFSHKTPQYTCTSYQGNTPAMIFCAMSINVSSYKNTLHFDKWIQNSKKDKLL